MEISSCTTPRRGDVGNNARNGTWGTKYDATQHVTGDPLFENAAGGDFTPKADSPLAGAGSAARAPTVDANLKSRPDPPSIGAIEP